MRNDIGSKQIRQRRTWLKQPRTYSFFGPFISCFCPKQAHELSSFEIYDQERSLDSAVLGE